MILFLNFRNVQNTDKLSNDKHASCSTSSDKANLNRTSGVKKVYIVKHSQHVKRIQQVWVLKTSN